MSPVPSITPPPLDKHERGRLKKLRKRAMNVENVALFSGIIDVNDSYELLSLERRERLSCESKQLGLDAKFPSAGGHSVQINWKNGSPRDVVIDSASHRELLAYLADQVGETTSAIDSMHGKTDDPTGQHKRKRGAATTSSKKTHSTFQWTSIHNRAMLRQLCVLEIQWLGDEPLQTIADRIQHVCREKTAIAVPTLWFQPNSKRPNDMTEALMYRPPPKTTQNEHRESKRGKKDDKETKPVVTSDLARMMLSLRLTQKQMEKEKFPSADTWLELSEPALPFPKATRGLPSSISQVDAESLLASKLVKVISCNIEGAVDYVMHQQTYQPRETGPLIFALDCEMVETTAGVELGQATLCRLESYDTTTRQMNTSLIFDVFVRPQNPIVDYKTKFSGLTAKILDDHSNTVSLEQVQAFVMTRVHPEDLLVGHSLENDLHSLRWVHNTVIDTAVLFRRKGRNTSKCSLKFLARQLLKKAIQAPDKPHCSNEDALTALELAVRRTVEGPEFDIASSPLLENWFSRQADCFPQTSFVGVGCNKWLQNNIVRTSTRAHAVVTSATVTAKTGNTMRIACTKKSTSRVLWASVATDTTDSIESLVSSLDISGVLVVALQAGISEAKELIEAKRLRQNPKATLQWTDVEEVKLQSAMNRSRNGYVIYISQASTPNTSTS